MGKVVGIDLGTTNSVVSVIEGGKPVVIANAEGMRTTPSVVAFSKEGERLVGQMARRQTVLNPQNTFYNVKRYLGRKYTELSSESKRVPYTVRKDELGNVKVRCPRLDKNFAPEEISAMVLRKLADEASRYMGQPVTGAVITVPAYFNDAQRQATRDAGRIAGLEVKRIINEPTAAALAYGLDQQFNQTILVFDLGGGTFDVSILDVRNGVFEVRATSGDTQLGGVNFDKKIVDWLADDFLEAEGVDLRRDRQALQRLTEAAEKAKVELSGLPTAEINLPFITATADGPKHIEKKLSRSQFESLCADLVSRLRAPVQQAMNDARVSPSQIDEVVLVGGSSRMPMVQHLVRSMLSKEPNQNVNPDEAVAVGAAIQAGILTEEVKDIMLLDVTPLSLGLETIGGVMKKVIPRNTTIPVRRSDVFSTSENNQTVVEVHIIQGEREMAVDNKSLGKFKLMGIPPAPRGIPQVQVSFDIDANGILQVSAMDKTTGREQSITVQEASNLAEDDIQRMLKEAEEFADVDRGQRERIEKRNRAETLTFQAERAMRSVSIDFGLQFARDRKRRIDNLIQDLRDALKREDERMVDMVQSELQDELYELNREAYLYDADNDEGNIFSQLGDTIKKAFEDDDDYYRRDYDWNGQSQWDSPSWSAGRRENNSRNGWDDWDDGWSRPAANNSSSSYDAPRGYEGRGDNQRRNYDAPANGYNTGNYNPNTYNQGRSDQDNYRSPQDRYSPAPYPQDQYNPGNSYNSAQNTDNQYGRGYNQDQYNQSQYGQNDRNNSTPDRSAQRQSYDQRRPQDVYGNSAYNPENPSQDSAYSQPPNSYNQSDSQGRNNDRIEPKGYDSSNYAQQGDRNQQTNSRPPSKPRSADSQDYGMRQSAPGGYDQNSGYSQRYPDQNSGSYSNYPPGNYPASSDRGDRSFTPGNTTDQPYSPSPRTSYTNQPNTPYSSTTGAPPSEGWSSAVDDDPWADNPPSDKSRNQPSGGSRRNYSGNSSSQSPNSQSYDDDWGEQDEVW